MLMSHIWLQIYRIKMKADNKIYIENAKKS